MQKGLLQNTAYIQDMDGILTSRIPYFVYNSHFATALPYIIFLEKSGTRAVPIICIYVLFQEFLVQKLFFFQGFFRFFQITF